MFCNDHGERVRMFTAGERGEKEGIGQVPNRLEAHRHLRDRRGDSISRLF